MTETWFELLGIGEDGSLSLLDLVTLAPEVGIRLQDGQMEKSLRKAHEEYGYGALSVRSFPHEPEGHIGERAEMSLPTF